MTEWNLRSRSRQCHACGAEFADGGICHSAVLSADAPAAQAAMQSAGAQGAAKKPDHIRLDFCPACWRASAVSAAEPALDFISAWQGVYSAPEAAAPEPLPKETAEGLLRRMLEQGGDDAAPAVVFLLAVMLERKRILIERGVRRGADGSLTRVYERRKTGEVMLIPDPDLDAAEIPDAQRRIDLLLSPAPPPAPQTPQG